MRKYLVLGAAIFLLLSSIALADISRYITVQGRLTDALDDPLSGSYQILFRIYDNPTAGNLEWQDTYTVDVIDGIFNVELGPIPSTVDFDEGYWLEVVVEGETLTDRIRMTSSGYAFSASRLYTPLDYYVVPEGISKINELTWIDGSCAAGSAIRAIDTAGGLTCEPVGGGDGVTCADCHTLYVNITGDTMTGELTIDLTGESSAAGRDAIEILASADNTWATIKINKDALQIWSSTLGDDADIWASDTYAERFFDIDNSAYYADFANAGTSINVAGTINANNFECTNCIDQGDIGSNAVGTSEIISSQVQRRVSGTCAAGSSIRVINEDGTVSCEPDDVGGADGVTCADCHTLYVNITGDTMTGNLGMGSNWVNFNNLGTGLNWGSAYSRIYDDGDLNINTDDDLWISAPGFVYVTSPSTELTGDLTVTGQNIFAGGGNPGGTGLYMSYAASDPDSGPAIRWTDGTLGKTIGIYISDGFNFQGNSVDNDLFRIRAPAGTGGLGAVKFQVDSSSGDVDIYGDVGIGTTSPIAKLHIYGEGITDGMSNSRIVLENSDNHNRWFLNAWALPGVNKFSIGRDGVADDLVIDEDGNVGIGDTSPAYKLDVSGDINTAGIYRKGGTAGTSLSCAAGQVIKGATVSGGIVTAGNCAADNTGGADGVSCADCHPLYVNITGDTMTGDLGMGSNWVNFDTSGRGLNWGSAFSKIYDDGDLNINTDDNLWISAPSYVYVTSPRLSTDDDLSIGERSSTDDDYLYFDNTNEYIRWDDNPGEFDITDDLTISGTTTATDFECSGCIDIGDIGPNVLSSLDGVANDGGNIDLVAGAGISITPSDAANTITITNTGGGDGAEDIYVNETGDTMSGSLYMADNGVYMRGTWAGPDTNHYIKWTSAVDGPRIAGCGGVDIYKTCGTDEQLAKFDINGLHLGGPISFEGGTDWADHSIRFGSGAGANGAGFFAPSDDTHRAIWFWLAQNPSKSNRIILYTGDDTRTDNIFDVEDQNYAHKMEIRANGDIAHRALLPWYTDWNGDLGDGGAGIVNDNTNYDALMIVGSDQNNADGRCDNLRCIRMWDRVTVEGEFYSTGNVGIGTTSPGAKLDVNGNTRTNNLYTGTIQGITNYLTLMPASASEYVQVGYGGTPRNLYVWGDLNVGGTIYDQDDTNVNIGENLIVNGYIDAKKNYLFGRLDCVAIVIDCHGECNDEGSPLDICQAYNSKYYPVSVDCEIPVDYVLNSGDCDWVQGDGGCTHFTAGNSLGAYCQDTGWTDATIYCCAGTWPV